MKKRNIRRTHQTNISSRDISPLPWSYFVVIAICGCVLAAGFFLAARQHFTSMDLGMKNSKLRKQLEDLESENRRLLLAREISLSPSEITKTARSLGFMEVTAPIAIVSVSVPNKAANPLLVKAVAEDSPTAAARPIALTMTAYQRPVKSVLDETPVKSTSLEKQTKKADAAKQKSIKPEITAIAKLK